MMKSNQSAAPAPKPAAADQKQLSISESKIEATLEKILSGHSEGITALTVLGDGRLASGSYDKTIKLWDVKRGQCVQTLSGHSDRVNALMVLGDGRLASGSLDKTIKLWDVKSGRCVQTLSGHSDRVNALMVLGDGRLASGSLDKTIKLWDVKSGQCVQTLSGHSGWVCALTVLGDGRLASGSMDRTIKLWDVKSGECVQTLSGHSRTIYALTMLGDGRLASGSVDKTIKLWDVVKGECVQTLSGHSYTVHALTMLGDGRLASGSDDTTIKFWDVESGECEQTLSGGSRSISALTMLGNGRLASGSHDNTIKLWDVGMQKQLRLRAEVQKEAELKKKAEEESRLKVEREAKEKGDRELREKAEKAEREKREMQNTLAAQAKKLAEMEAKLQQMELQQSTKPAVGLSVSFEIPYSELQKEEKLGTGGFGVVYKGKWKFQNVAIKELLDEKPSEKAAAEFKEEMQIMAKLHSEHVIRLNGCVLGNPKYCIVMEYMPKGSLFNVLHSSQVLNWWTRYKIARDIASGLAFLHASSILHRDLKSLNVLLDEHYRAKLTDFGLSKLKTETRTTTRNQSVGSDGWVAPELTEPDAHHTQKCDVFSLGITFWEIATRKLPYEKTPNRSFISFWYAQKKREAIPEECPPKFAHLIKWCWDTDPAKRPTAVEAMKYLQDRENDFKSFNTEQAAAAPVNADASEIANSFMASVRK